jgi:hypothetical protein
MALTKEQLINRFATNYANKRRSTLVWTDITQMVASAGEGTKQSIVDAIKSNNSDALGKIMFRLADEFLKVKAVDDITTMFANNRITVADLGSILE